MKKYIQLYIVTAIGWLVAAVCAKYQMSAAVYITGLVVGSVGVSILEEE